MGTENVLESSGRVGSELTQSDVNSELRPASATNTELPLIQTRALEKQPSVATGPAGPPTVSEISDEIREKDEKIYEKLVERLEGDSSDAGREYDKWLLTLASSALGLSFVFLKDIAPHDKPWAWAECLYFAWGAFLVSTLAILVNLHLRYSAAAALRNIADDHYARYTEGKVDRDSLWVGMRKEQLSVKRCKFIELLNLFSLGLFMLGLIGLMGFIWANRPTGPQAASPSTGLSPVSANNGSSSATAPQIFASTAVADKIPVTSTSIPASMPATVPLATRP